MPISAYSTAYMKSFFCLGGFPPCKFEVTSFWKFSHSFYLKAIMQMLSGVSKILFFISYTSCDYNFDVDLFTWIGDLNSLLDLPPYLPSIHTSLSCTLANDVAVSSMNFYKRLLVNWFCGSVYFWIWTICHCFYLCASNFFIICLFFCTVCFIIE